MSGRTACRYDLMTGVGGIGAGILFALEGNHDLGRNESRAARLLESRDYCKLQIISHFTALFTGATPEGRPFHVLPVGKVGRDAAGDRLLAEMREAGLDCRFVEAAPDLPTLFAVCYQFPDGAGGNLTPVNAAPSRLAAADLDAVQPWLEKAGSRAIALAAPEVPLAVRADLLERATRTGACRVASFIPGEMKEALGLRLLDKVDLLAINEDEASALTGVPYKGTNPGPVLESLARFAGSRRPGMRLLLSVGPAGVYGFEEGRWVHRPALPVKPVSTAGAGDTLLGGVLAALVRGLPFLPDRPDFDGEVRSALEFGSLLAGLSVLSPHTIAPDVTPANLPALCRVHGIRLYLESMA